MTEQSFKKALITVTCSLTILSMAGQTPRINTLKEKAASATEPGTKTEALLAVCREKNSLPADTLAVYAKAALILSQEQRDLRSSAWATYYLTFVSLAKGKTDSVLSIIDSLTTATETSKTDSELPFRLVLLKANALNRSNKTKEALAILYNLLTKAEKENNGVAQAYADVYIGTSYEIQGEYQEALQWFRKGIVTTPLPVPAAYEEVYCSLILNAGITYFDQFQENKNPRDQDSAAYLLTQAIARANASEYLSTLAYGKSMLGGLYSYNKKFAEAEKLFTEGLAIRKLIGDPYYIINDILSLGNFYLNSNQPDKAGNVSKEGMQLSDLFHINSGRVPLYNILADSYRQKGDMVMYGETLRALVRLQDSLFKVNSAEALSDLQTRYEVQKKETTIIRQQYDLSRKNIILYGTIGLLALTLLAGFAFFRNRKKDQLLKLQAMAIEQDKKITQAVMQAEEEERKRIAADLHDSVAQKLVVARLNFEALENRLEQLNDEQGTIVRKIHGLLDETATEVRGLSHSMVPQAFTQAGLTEAVRDFLDKIADPSLSIHFHASGEIGALSENKALMIYRVIQEAVQNVLKHADASELDIALMSDSDELEISIEDNGKGFDAADLSGKTNGLSNIRSRIQYLGGHTEINSKPGEGTVIVICIPIHESGKK